MVDTHHLVVLANVVKNILHRAIATVLSLAVFITIVTISPRAISLPSALPTDPSKEDLTRIDYPSTKHIRWTPYFMEPQDSLETLFGKDWVSVAKFNRIDRRHAYPGVTIKKPADIAEVRDYNPMPLQYAPAETYPKYILINVTEQWLGGYEFGKLKISMPAATGMKDHTTPLGLFQVEAYDRWHTSSLYKIQDREEQYPMDYALRFLIEDGMSYWIHARDLPGKPASHGCIGLMSEPMQKRVYGSPARPLVDDAEVLYKWVVGDDEDETGAGIIEDGPTVEIVGGLPPSTWQ